MPQARSLHIAKHCRQRHLNLVKQSKLTALGKSFRGCFNLRRTTAFSLDKAKISAEKAPVKTDAEETVKETKKQGKFGRK